MPLITPTVGRVVLVYPRGRDSDSPPLAGIIAHVHSDILINVGVFASDGTTFALTSVSLIPADEDIPYGEDVATWMPYQVAQAAKAAEAEAQKNGTDTVKPDPAKIPTKF